MSTRGCRLTRETTGPSRAPRQHTASPTTVPAKHQAKPDGTSALGLQEAQGLRHRLDQTLWCNKQDLDHGAPREITGYLITLTSGEERRANVLCSLRLKVSSDKCHMWIFWVLIQLQKDPGRPVRKSNTN